VNGFYIKSRDDARDMFDELNITEETVDDKFLGILWNCINQKMQESFLYQGSYKMVIGVSKFMTCETYLWYDREVISFNSDGFIGIAGWADEQNVIPILKGIEIALNDWVENSEVTV